MATRARLVPIIPAKGTPTPAATPDRHVAPTTPAGADGLSAVPRKRRPLGQATPPPSPRPLVDDYVLDKTTARCMVVLQRILTQLGLD